MTPVRGGKFGPYEIVSLVGEGGMGEVWQARDTRLGRTVAIKFYKHGFESRFEREAHAVAALNHPHICTLHDVGPGYLVMELLHGTPLRGRQPLEKVLEYAGQILDALEAAHRAGIVHRDLKPANIFVTKDGVKLLDFGLAKQAPRLGENDSTVTTDVSGQGQIVGTLEYMSPEQLQGRPADARSDIFSFGCVLYEMLTGRKAFSGTSAASVIAAILDREPAPMQEAPPLERIVKACLAKDPDERFQTAADLKRSLQWAGEERGAEGKSQWRGWLPWTLAAAGLMGGMVLGWAMLKPQQGGGLPVSRNVRITHDGRSFVPALSPDGKLVAYASSRTGSADLDIYVQQLSGKGTVRLTQDPARDTQPVFSADGTTVYFTSSREPAGIYEVAALGGDARLVAAGGTSPSASPDGKWLAYLKGGKLWVQPAGGGQGREVSAAKWEDMPAVWSPDGRRLSVMLPGDGGLGLVAADGSGTERVGFVENLRKRGMFEQSYSLVQGWTQQNDLLFSAPYGDSVNVWRVAASEAGRGTPRPVTLGNSQQMPSIDARGGKLVYTANNSIQGLWVLPANLNQGTVGGPPRQLPTEKANAYHQDVSPDGKLVAYASRKGGMHGIWLMDLETGKERLLRQCTEETESFAHLQFSPDGRQLAATFSGYREPGRTPTWHIVLINTATGELQALTKRGARIRGWSRDGRHLMAWTSSQPTQVVAVDVESREFVAILVPREQPLSEPRLSPDGRWVAFISGSTLVAAPFRGDRKVEESEWVRLAEPAGYPFWSPDGRNLYYKAGASGRRDSALFLRQGWDGAAGKPRGTAVEFHRFEGHMLGGPIVNQVVGWRGGLVVGLQDQVSDIWALDWMGR